MDSSPLAGRRHRCWLVIVAVVVVVMVVAWGRPTRGPDAPYDHRGFNELSVATAEVVAGQATTAVRGLSDLGFWCVQPRRNDRAVQIACRSPERDVQVDLVAAPEGDLLYADIDLGALSTATARGPGDRLFHILDASLMQVWPQDRTSVHDLVQEAQPRRFLSFGGEAPPDDPEEQYSTHDQRTGNAHWSLWSRYTGEPLALRVRTSGLEDRSWPFGGQHYARSVDAATSELVGQGFTCATACYRASGDQAVDFDEHDGQIVAIRFALRSSAEGDDRRADPSGQWVRAGLPFLTPATEGAVGEVVEANRLAHRSWRGVVAGTPVDIVAEPGGSVLPDGRPGRDLTVTIGIPLLHVE